MKRIFLMMLFSLFCLSSCSLQSAPPESIHEELISHQWCIKNNHVKTGELEFLSENQIKLTADIGSETMDLEGTCFINDQKISVISDDWGELSFSYRLEREYLYLQFFDKEIVLEKEE